MMATRNPWIDQIKGIACLLIVIHHLAFYGPMTDVLEPFLERTVSWFRDYARMAVQVFLVLGGYLCAAALAPDGVARQANVFSLLVKRFIRLVVPYVAALVVTVAITESLRVWGFRHDSMSASPQLFQVLAHIFLLHGILGLESLSAGAWYVAIDFQLFAIAALGFGASGRFWPVYGSVADGLTLTQMGVALLTLVSLLVWNLQSDFDVWAIYFFGAYGLGMMAWWASHGHQPSVRRIWLQLMVVMIVVALAFEWRDRIALAGVTALLLAGAQALTWPKVLRFAVFKPLQRLGQISYSVFLIHFGVSLLVNAVIYRHWPASVTANVIGVVVAVVLSVWAGALLYRWVEVRSLGWFNFGSKTDSSIRDKNKAIAPQ